MTHLLVQHEGRTYTVLRVVDDFGQKSLDLVGAPRRCADLDDRAPLFLPNVDFRHVRHVVSPAQQLTAASTTTSWVSLSGRAQAKLFAAFLLGEDPQRRLESQKAAALMHQMSLVQHVLSTDGLRKVLVADEVGLGKTIEAGMLVRRLLEQHSHVRVLYLAPARLVSNVVAEFRQKLDLDARQWISGNGVDARLDSDRLVVASMHKAVFGENLEQVRKGGPWDVVIIDECHHLSDWGDGGGKPNQGYRLAEALAKDLPPDGRLVLLSGTPHQGNLRRFENLLRLLCEENRDLSSAAGRVIYRTKDRVRDWRGRPLFPRRDVRPPVVVSLGGGFHSWYEAISDLYERADTSGSAGRAAGWAKGQALQWASSSVEAGLGFLVRLAIRRLDWNATHPVLARALVAIRPYRGGSADEPVAALYARLRKELAPQILVLDDQEEFDEEAIWRPDETAMAATLDRGIKLLAEGGSEAKWRALDALIADAGSEKVVLFAQPVETVGAVVRYLEKRFGASPAVIVGNQSDEERVGQVERFRKPGGPRFLVSSRAGGEGLNMQVARRLIHLDVPWNPMELEQRIGRVHRFGSRKTILVDTLVVQGTREVDMYQTAREKLRLIATQMDAEQFEALFSRVMSLVPPKELESIMGMDAAARMEGDAVEAIGRLVRDGYTAWEEFDRKYRDRAEEIRSLEPGEAGWADLQEYLLGTCGAEVAPEVNLTTFEFEGDEIVDRQERIAAVRFAGDLYVCADTSGTPAESDDGVHVPTLGMNHPQVREWLRSSLMTPEVGAAYVNRPTNLGDAFPETFGVLVFVRHLVRFAPGETTEHGVTFHLFVVDSAGGVRELPSEERAQLSRTLYRASRVREPRTGGLAEILVERERSLAERLRGLSDEERSQGLRPAVWPVAAFAVV